MSKPTADDMEKFIQIFDKLSQFEAQQRLIRGHGCFANDEQLPIPEVVKVLSWLKQKAVTQDKDALDQIIKKYEKKAESLKAASVSAHSRNDYISYSTFNEEAEIYENIVGDLKAVGGLRKLKKR